MPLYGFAGVGKTCTMFASLAQPRVFIQERCLHGSCGWHLGMQLFPRCDDLLPMSRVVIVQYDQVLQARCRFGITEGYNNALNTHTHTHTKIAHTGTVTDNNIIKNTVNISFSDYHHQHFHEVCSFVMSVCHSADTCQLPSPFLLLRLQMPANKQSMQGNR